MAEGEAAVGGEGAGVGGGGGGEIPEFGGGPADTGAVDTEEVAETEVEVEEPTEV